MKCGLCGLVHGAGYCDDFQPGGAAGERRPNPRSLRSLLQATEAARAMQDGLLSSAIEAMRGDDAARAKWLDGLTHARKFAIPTTVKVWVVYTDDGDHGFSEPLAVCLTKTGASARAMELNHDYTACYIKDVEVSW